MDLKNFRQQMDALDDQLIALFEKRMRLSGEIAEYKKAQGLPVADIHREHEKQKALRDKMPEDLQGYVDVLYDSLFALSRSYQNRLLKRHPALNQQIEAAIAETDPLFPREATVGVYGAETGQVACEALFRRPLQLPFHSLTAVFQALEEGLCQYGVIPADSKVYSLLARHHCFIVRSFRMPMDYSLLTHPGVSEPGEIFIPESAAPQCSEFLKSMGQKASLTVCASAAAAVEAAENSEAAGAVVPSFSCRNSKLLRLRSSLQDPGCTQARFFCISNRLEIYPGADHSSILLSAPHQPGSLYKLLAQFYALDVNVSRLYSTPIPGREFDSLFCLDLESSIYSQEFVQVMCELSAEYPDFQYLGSYTEVH